MERLDKAKRNTLVKLRQSGVRKIEFDYECSEDSTVSEYTVVFVDEDENGAMVGGSTLAKIVAILNRYIPKNDRDNGGVGTEGYGTVILVEPTFDQWVLNYWHTQTRLEHGHKTHILESG